MKKVKIILDRTTCIDCGACIPEADGFFVEDTNKEVHLVKKTTNNGNQEVLELEVDDKTHKALLSAKDICPVAAIEVVEIS
ncbi:MAG: hypothetical protein ACD_24C00520G0003 [uncultured bacterium]|uniref:Ferredoxin n=1 Tax=candidate division WWE3 bacterium RBG_16_37_10 TaxID=1802610 RepID=A0A1F4UV18_UNCKA|nr:MAG: hypothetical protein ACD_24C00520G0003 [uncultured bacterium]OGC48043.1 MAG: hypothetical protein A2W32_01640 [candidate division WWE3 bacterium RBG_16_37_10]